MNRLKVGILCSHPIQYYSPLFRAISDCPYIDLTVYYCHNQTKKDQSLAGFSTEFEWDIPLMEGYNHIFLNNISKNPSVYNFFGCDTPEISEIIKSKNYNYFIVFGWYLKSFWQAMIACWKTKTNVLIRGDSQLNTKRNTVKKLIKYPIYRFFISKFDGYLYVGERSKEYYIHYGADKRKMFFTPHCVDNQFFENEVKKYNSLRLDLKQKFGIPSEALILLFVGKLIPKKRPFDFVKAIELVNNSDNKIFGLLAGDGEKLNDLNDYIKKRKLPIKTLGFLNQSELPKLYSISDILILPSGSHDSHLK